MIRSSEVEEEKGEEGPLLYSVFLSLITYVAPNQQLPTN